MARPKRGLRVPLPVYLLDRLNAGDQACVLTAVDRSANVGEPLLLINEKLKPPDEIMGWGVVEMTEGIEFPSALAALNKLGPAVDEVSAREYVARNPKPTFAYKLKLVEAFKEPRDVDAAGRRIPSVKDDGFWLDADESAELAAMGLTPRWSEKRAVEFTENVVFSIDDAKKFIGQHRTTGKKTVLDLFSGMGGLSLGFESVGFVPVMAVDMSDPAVATYALNRLDTCVLNADIRRIDPATIAAAIGPVDAVIGGVPCEAFSGLANVAESRGGERSTTKDMIYRAMDIVRAVKPKIFCFENVPLAPKTPQWIKAASKIAKEGYGVEVIELRADEVGGATTRKRAFFVGVKDGVAPKFDSIPKSEGVPVSRAISGQKPPGDPLTMNQSNLTERVVNALRRPDPWKREGSAPRLNFLNERVLDGKKPAPTLTAGTNLIHHGKKRWVDGREMARIQGVPDSYKFAVESWGGVRSLLGDCVPVQLGRAVARALLGAAYARKSDDDIAFVATLAHDAVKKMDDDTFAATAERLADIWDNRFGDGPDEPDGLAREEILGAALIMMDAAAGRKVQLGDRYLFESAKELTTAQKADLAPVNPGSDGEHEPLELADAVEHVKPIILRDDFVSLIGSLPQWEKTRGDVDVKIEGPLDDETAHAVKFRVGRMFPPEISKRLQFHVDPGRPYTTNVPMYRLALLPVTHDMVQREGAEFRRIEMAELPVDKQDVYMLYPASPNRSVRSVLQLEFQKRSVHIDWRIAVRSNQLIGWTLFAAKKGAIGSDVTALAQARGLAAGLSLDGNRILKPLQVTDGRGLQAVPKRPPPPVAWLDVDQRVWEEETKDGKTKHVMISVDRPMVGFGRIEPHFKEYFLTRGQRFNGTMFGRLTVGRGGTEEEEEAGRVTPEGETFWKFLVSEKPLPSILRRRSVRLKRMPPDGVAAIPRDLQALVPAEFRYWEKKGAEALKTRDALVESKFFTEDNVAVVGGRYVRVEERKKFYSVPRPEIEKAGVVDGTYRLVWQTWKRRAETRRAGPSRQKWHLLVRAGGKKYGWTFEQNPIVTKRASGVSGAHTEGDWRREGEIEPGTTGGMIENDTTATPSHTTVSESGKTQVLTEAGPEKGSLLIRLETSDSAKMIAVHPEEEGSRQWVSELVSEKEMELSAMDDGAVVVFASTGPEALQCGCGGAEFDRRGTTVECLSCGVSADVRHHVSYAWELNDDGAELGAIPVVKTGSGEPRVDDGEPKLGDEDLRDTDGDRTVKSAHVVPIRKGKEKGFEGYFKDIVLKPNDGVDGPLEPDTQNDIYSGPDVDYAMRWNARNRKTDNIQHGELGVATGDWGFIIVQNYLADVDFWLGPNGEAVKEPNDWRDGILESPGEDYQFVPKGAWIREGFATGKKLKTALESNEIGAWSIEGFATKVPEMVDLPSRLAA